MMELQRNDMSEEDKLKFIELQETINSLKKFDVNSLINSIDTVQFIQNEYEVNLIINEEYKKDKR